MVDAPGRTPVAESVIANATRQKLGKTITVTNKRCSIMSLPGFQYRSENFTIIFRRIKTLSGVLSIPGPGPCINLHGACGHFFELKSFTSYDHVVFSFRGSCVVWISLFVNSFPGLATLINTHYRRHDPQTVLVTLLIMGWHKPATLQTLLSVFAG